MKVLLVAIALTCVLAHADREKHNPKADLKKSLEGGSFGAKKREVVPVEKTPIVPGREIDPFGDDEPAPAKKEAPKEIPFPAPFTTKYMTGDMFKLLMKKLGNGEDPNAMGVRGPLALDGNKEATWFQLLAVSPDDTEQDIGTLRDKEDADDGRPVGDPEKLKGNAKLLWNVLGNLNLPPRLIARPEFKQDPETLKFEVIPKLYIGIEMNETIRSKWFNKDGTRKDGRKH